MSLAVLASRALCGMHAPEVFVEVHLAQGLPSFTIVGLPDAGVRESRERVRSAILSSGYTFPAGRLTANLAPATFPKSPAGSICRLRWACCWLRDNWFCRQNGSADTARHCLCG